MRASLSLPSGRRLCEARPIEAHRATAVAAPTPIGVPERPIAAVAGLLAVLLIVLAEVALGPGLQVTGLLTGPPFLAAAFVSPRRTALVAAVSVIANAGLAIQTGALFDASQVVRLAGVASAGIGAVLLTIAREREQRQSLNLAQIAQVAQLAVLRSIPQRVGPTQVAVRYLSAAAEATVGGDFYEALRTEQGTRAIVGDVRGKGLGSVQLASVVIGAFRGADHDTVSLERLARSIDSAFVRFEPDDEAFATAVIVEVDSTGMVTVVNCGHPAPLLIKPGSVNPIEPPIPSPPLGLGAHPDCVQHRMCSNDRLLLFTDGIIEARSGAQMFDLVGHAPLLGRGSLEEALDHLIAALHEFLPAGVGDDVALMLLQLA